jgi:hypothetical protein
MNWGNLSMSMLGALLIASSAANINLDFAGLTDISINNVTIEQAVDVVRAPSKNEVGLEVQHFIFWAMSYGYLPINMVIRANSSQDAREIALLFIEKVKHQAAADETTFQVAPMQAEAKNNSEIHNFLEAKDKSGPVFILSRVDLVGFKFTDLSQ